MAAEAIHSWQITFDYGGKSFASRSGSPSRNNYDADWHTTKENTDMGRYEEQKDASSNALELLMLFHF